MLTQSQRDLRTFMAIAEEQAIAEARQKPTSPDIKRRARALTEFARNRLAQMQREERAKRPSNVVSGAIRAAIRAMNLPQMIARLNEMRVLHPTMQFAHRDYEHMAEEDVRSALEDAESLIERGE
jgi:hypothetical protein